MTTDIKKYIYVYIDIYIYTKPENGIFAHFQAKWGLRLGSTLIA